jgi:DNA polymerase III alpha subunit (gram-positive type)
MGRVCCGDLGLEKRTKHEYHPAMFAELCATSNFTFLTGASHPEELVARAMVLGLPAVAIADVNSVSGIVRAHTKARTLARELADRRATEARDGVIGPPLRHC